jgi:hypothetical protein
MNDHRPPPNPSLEGNKLAKAADDLTSGAKLQHSWLDDARQSAYATKNVVTDSAEHAPMGTAVVFLGLGVAVSGALGTGLARRALAAVTEGELFSSAGKVAATAAEREGLAAGTDALAGAGKTMVHLTTAEGQIGIANTLKIGSRWGIFGLESTQVPENALLRKATSLVPKELSAEVAIGPNASRYFKAPTPVGPFSLVRNLAGVKSTPLGSIDLARDAFIPNEIFSNGAFRPATGAEVTKYKIHQWLLDYGIDASAYVLAGTLGATSEYKALCEKSDKKRETHLP